jgi:DnaA-like protein
MPFHRQPPTVKRVIELCADDYRVTAGMILGPSRSQQVSRARCKAIKILRGMKFSSPQIGRFLHIHHSSVLHALKRHLSPMDEPGPELQKLTDQQIEAAVWDLWVARFSLGRLNPASAQRRRFNGLSTGQER